jgi:L-fucose mutarotase/ribose pyranase (RbsD/FucU family)
MSLFPTTLRCIGHGDEIALVPTHWVCRSVVFMAPPSPERSMPCCLSCPWIISFLKRPWGMQVVDQADKKIPIFAEFRESIARRAGPHVAAPRADAEINTIAARPASVTAARR